MEMMRISGQRVDGQFTMQLLPVFLQQDSKNKDRYKWFLGKDQHGYAQIVELDGNKDLQATYEEYKRGETLIRTVSRADLVVDINHIEGKESKRILLRKEAADAQDKQYIGVTFVSGWFNPVKHAPFTPTMGELVTLQAGKHAEVDLGEVAVLMAGKVGEEDGYIKMAYVLLVGADTYIEFNPHAMRKITDKETNEKKWIKDQFSKCALAYEEDEDPILNVGRDRKVY